MFIDSPHFRYIGLKSLTGNSSSRVRKAKIFTAVLNVVMVLVDVPWWISREVRRPGVQNKVKKIPDLCCV